MKKVKYKFTFYYIYIKTASKFVINQFIKKFTFYYIYIKTAHLLQTQILHHHLHSTIFILKRKYDKVYLC